MFDIYRPPVAVCSEFELELVTITSPTASPHFRALPTASILLFIKSGSAYTLTTTTATTTATSAGGGDSVSKGTSALPPIDITEGSIVFLPADLSATLSLSSISEQTGINSKESDVIVYRAHINLG